MSNHKQYSSTPEASKVVARNQDLPQCEGLRACAALTAAIQFLHVTKRCPGFDLTMPVQMAFGLLGFMTAAYMLRDRDLTSDSEPFGGDTIGSSIRGLIGSIPLPQMAVVIGMVLFLPQMFALESMNLPDYSEVPALIIKMFSSYFAGFQKPGFNGQSLIFFPLIILFVPRRLFSLIMLSVFSAGLVLQFAGLFTSSTRAASLVASPSAFDLLSVGTVLAVFTRLRRIGQSEAQIGTSAIVAGLILAVGLVANKIYGGGSSLGAFALFAAPQGFGVINFFIEITATTMVSSLWWRDLGGMVEDVTRAPVN